MPKRIPRVASISERHVEHPVRPEAHRPAVVVLEWLGHLQQHLLLVRTNGEPGDDVAEWVAGDVVQEVRLGAVEGGVGGDRE